MFVVILVVGLFLYVVARGLTNSQPPEAASSAGPVTAAVPRYRIGQDVWVGYWGYHCNGVRWRKQIGSEDDPQLPDALFLVVDLTIENRDTSASILPSLELIDAEGRTYDESDKQLFVDGSFGPLKSVNPGVSSRGYVLFDVPRGNYWLQVSGGLLSDQRALIRLYR